jgi:hypothetical protein
MASAIRQRWIWPAWQTSSKPKRALDEGGGIGGLRAHLLRSLAGAVTVVDLAEKALQ